jgi:hypothetical protein
VLAATLGASPRAHSGRKSFRPGRRLSRSGDVPAQRVQQLARLHRLEQHRDGRCRSRGAVPRARCRP